MSGTLRLRAATLAVGTEVTDGQIIDRNSAWISQKLVHAGIEIVEHRAVADDRAEIARALRDLGTRVSLLFVTGGLGPTSDDFTRDVLADVFARPLEWHEESWTQINEKLTKRGVVVRDIQRQQCYYPRGARVLFNPAGTANAFMFEGALSEPMPLKVYALPGPPPEIAAVWEHNLASEIEALVPADERETLHIFRTLGRPESEVAEKTEEVIKGSALRVGYRAHAPYVEVKLWVRRREEARLKLVVAAVEKALGDWIINRDDDDVADEFLTWLTQSNARVRVIDAATDGVLQERLAARLREKASAASKTQASAASLAPGPAHASFRLTIENCFGAVESLPAPEASVNQGSSSNEILIWLGLASGGLGNWVIGVHAPGKAPIELAVEAPFNYNLRGERARRFVAEKALHLFSTILLEKLGHGSRGEA
jgi:molybdenum cofactor synthesis domain-containing protein